MEVERRGWTSFARVIANWETRRSINFRSRFAVARRQGNGWDEPYKPRGLRTVLWAARGEIPPADPANLRFPATRRQLQRISDAEEAHE
jgi:hypothetical protein